MQQNERKKWNTKDTSQNVFENTEVGQEEVQKVRDFMGTVKSEKKGGSNDTEKLRAVE